MSNYIIYLQQAITAYEQGKLQTAWNASNQAYHTYLSYSADSIFTMDYLNIRTLQQSIALKLHNFTAYQEAEPQVREIMFQILGSDAASYYALHLLDACQGYCSYGDLSSAQWYLEEGMRILTEENVPCPLLDFLHAYHNAKIHFSMEQYYSSLADALSANESWLDEHRIPDDAPSFLVQANTNESWLAQMEFSVLLVICYCYCKLGSYDDALALLQNLAAEPSDCFYIQASLDLCFAEVYTKTGQHDLALPFYQKYCTQDLKQFPDLASTLLSLSFALKHNTNDFISYFQPASDAELSSSLYYGRDALQIHLYNYALTLVASDEPQKALSIFEQLGSRGYSMRLYLLAELGQFSHIPALKAQADAYYQKEITNLFLYYDEKLVCNHLALLEYHFSLCLHAYLACHEAFGEERFPASCIYDFVINTKYISMEAAALSKQYHTRQDLEGLKKRTPFMSKDIQNRLSEDTVLLEFCQSRSLDDMEYIVFFVTRYSIHCLLLDTADSLDRLLLQWHENLLATSPIAGQPPVMNTFSGKELDTKLRRTLFRPLKDWFCASEYKKIMVAPAGALSLFSFTLLSTSAGTYLGDRYEISYLNTGKELLFPIPVDGLFSPSSLVIGNPATLSYPPLPYAEKEAYTVAHFLQSHAYTGEEATLSLFQFSKDHAPALIHAATHGIYHAPDKSQNFDWNHACFTMEHSGLILADDKLLSCDIISAMSLDHVRLAVLSACQSGSSYFSNADGYYGLRRAFKLAGCSSLLVTLWPVEDRSCFLFMRSFYQVLTTQQTSPKEAFQATVAFLRTYEENGIHPFSHPFFWAGYIFQE